MKAIIKNRTIVQLFFAAIVYFVAVYFANGLLYVFAGSLLLGVVFGKVFCKWMCPIGLIKSLMMKNMSEDQAKAHMFNYYKVGCPISWVQGFFNKYSLFKIRKKDTCISCGLCDKTCYIPSFDKQKSVFKTTKDSASEAFNCSKCLKCVDVCPNGSLKYSLK